MEKLDKKDLRILYELDYNARVPLTKLAKEVGLSTQLTGYRLNRLVKRGVVKKFVALIDMHKLGFFSYRLYIRFQKVSPQEYPGIVKYLSDDLPSVWVISTSGRWDTEVVLLAKNPIEFNEILRNIREKLAGKIKGYTISPSMFTYHFKRTYLLGAERETIPESFLYGFEYEPYALDEKDVKILDALSKNARLGNKELGRRVGLSDAGVSERVKKLEKEGIIQSYRVFFDVEKLGKKLYKALVSTKTIGKDDEKRIYSFCASRPEVAYFVECFGEWDFEIEVEVNDERDFRNLMNEFMNEFADIAEGYEVLHVYKEHKVDYFPLAKMLLK